MSPDISTRCCDAVRRQIDNEHVVQLVCWWTISYYGLVIRDNKPEKWRGASCSRAVNYGSITRKVTFYLHGLICVGLGASKLCFDGWTQRESHAIWAEALEKPGTAVVYTALRLPLQACSYVNWVQFTTQCEKRFGSKRWVNWVAPL